MTTDPRLLHAIAPGTRLAAAVRLGMHGEIKLGSRWHGFQAEQVIVPSRGMIWAARASVFGLPVTGGDCVVDCAGLTQFKALGLVTLVSAAGRDVARSAAGRMLGETGVWLPSALVHGPMTVCGETIDQKFVAGDDGCYRGSSFLRWGNPDGGVYRYIDFGVVVEEEKTFSGYTIPVRIRAGWWIGTERFEREGDFFHATIDKVEYK